MGYYILKRIKIDFKDSPEDQRYELGELFMDFLKFCYEFENCKYFINIRIDKYIQIGNKFKFGIPSKNLFVQSYIDKTNGNVAEKCFNFRIIKKLFKFV